MKADRAGRAATRTAPKLPSLDETGKLHGPLPKPQDLPRYSTEQLTQLRDDLKQSGQRRIDVTSRQGAEQALIKTIEKILEGR